MYIQSTSNETYRKSAYVERLEKAMASRKSSSLLSLLLAKLNRLVLATK